MAYFVVLFIALFPLFLLICYSFHTKNELPTDWPLIRMLPTLVQCIPRILERIVEVLENSQLTFLFKGPWFSNMHMLLTVDPTNIHHIMIKNHSNYIRGSKFIENMEVFGEGILNTDADVWMYHRKMSQSLIGHPRFQRFLVKETWEKVEDGLIPVLDHVAKHSSEVDMQDLFLRFTFDISCIIIMDHDPKTLSINSPSDPASKALNDVEEVILRRFVMPRCIWKLQRWLSLGLEKKHKEASHILDTFIYKCITTKREELGSNLSRRQTDNVVAADALTLYMGESGGATTGENDDKALRDTALSFLIAGRDTVSTALTWFFYLLSKNPQVVSKIKEELDVQQKYNDKEQHNSSISLDELDDKLVYLHAALCETLRLYPPVAFEAKVPVESDILPSGHKVYPNLQIIFALHAMGRMKSIWGDDCYEFKPERWIMKNGSIRHEPSHKFFAFNAGPRTCLGKQIAFVQMKAVAATILNNYHIQAVEGHPVVPSFSIILRMKYGFKVKVLRSK